MRPSSAEDDALNRAVAAGEPSGAPASIAAVSAAAVADLARSHTLSATGGPVASRAAQVSWAMYDFARTPYVLLITIYIFAPYFANTLASDPVRGQSIWGDIQAYSGFVIALLAPFIGAIADAGGRRKPWIAVFTALMILCTGLLWFAKADHSGLSIFEIGMLVAMTNVCYEFASVFYNAMLPSIVSHARVGSLSGLSLALGNLSGLLLLIFMIICFSLPGHVSWSFIPAHPLFGIDPALHEPERLTGPIAAGCMLVFSLLLFVFTPDRARTKTNWIDASVTGFKSVIRTVRSLKHYRNVATYLLARLFFNDGMTALLVFGGIYVSGVFHWGALAMMAYGILLSIFAVFGGFFGGWLDDRLGSKAALFVSVGGTAVLGLISITMGPDRILWFIPYDPNSAPVDNLPFFRTLPEVLTLVVFVLIAITVTASYANARTMMARIAPLPRMTEFFGLFSLSGQSTSFLATLSVSILTAWTHSQRGGFLAVIAFLVLGLIGMIWVQEERAEAV